MSTAAFVNGFSGSRGHVGDTLTYKISPGLVSGTDCNVQNATIYFLFPNNVKADNACLGVTVCDVSGYAGVIVVATHVNITRALVTDSTSSEVCTGTPSPAFGCTWNVPGSYTIALADRVNNHFDGMTCAAGIANPCEVVALSSVSDEALTDPTTTAAGQGGIAVSVLVPNISVVKTASPKVLVNGQVSVSALVTNTGNAQLNSVTVTDDHALILTGCPSSLAVGASCTATGTYTAPGTPGTVTDTVTASGTDVLATTGSTVTATSSASTTVVNIGIGVTKTASSKVGVGGTISVSATVTNTGSSTLTGVTATDDHAGVLTCLATTLAAGVSTTCTGSYTAPGTPGTVTDTVTASGSGQIGAPVTATATATTQVIQVGISVTKTATAKVEVGGAISVSATVTNSGSSSLTGVTATDDHAGVLTCLATTLAAGVSTTCTGSYTAPGTPGTVTDTVTVTGTDQTGATATATASATTTLIQAGVSVTMACSPDTQKAPGTITWTVVVTNTGTTSESVNVNDTIHSPPALFSGTLAPGASQTTTITDTNLGASDYADAATTIATDQTGATATATSNTAICHVTTQELTARWTGGGRFDVPFVLTHGFELHCTANKNPNNLEVNWISNGKEYHFHLLKLATSSCFYDPAIGSPNMPRAPVNTIIITGSGKLNGKAGYTIYASFTDQGQPASGKDPSTIKITAPDGTTVVLDMENTVLMHGAQQAHACTGNAC